MKSLLIENARSIHRDQDKRKDWHHRIERAVYLERTLYTTDDFFNLVWMEAENILGSDLYNQLTPREEPRTLKKLVERIRDCYPGNSSHEILEQLNRKLSALRQVTNYNNGTNTSENNTWFEGCVAINGTFDPRLIPELWVRDLLRHESEQSPEGIYYIEDGCHRALVYALNLAFNEKEYIPVKVRWCKSWRHILPWAQEPEH